MDSCNPRTQYTPECFMAVLEVASENENTVVVQAWIEAEARWILPTWCEFDDQVIDLTERRTPIPKAEYYAVMGVTEPRTRRYARLAYFSEVAASSEKIRLRRLKTQLQFPCLRLPRASGLTAARTI